MSHPWVVYSPKASTDVGSCHFPSWSAGGPKVLALEGTVVTTYSVPDSVLGLK